MQFNTISIHLFTFFVFLKTFIQLKELQSKSNKEGERNLPFLVHSSDGSISQGCTRLKWTTMFIQVSHAIGRGLSTQYIFYCFAQTINMQLLRSEALDMGCCCHSWWIDSLYCYISSNLCILTAMFNLTRFNIIIDMSIFITTFQVISIFSCLLASYFQ